MSKSSLSRTGQPRSVLIVLILLSSLCLLQAAPFAKRFQYTQPDGTAIQLWGEGDEFYAVFETLDGYTVVFDQALKAYCYATLSPDGTQLLSTGVQPPAAVPNGLEQHLRVAREAMRQQAAARRDRWEAGVGLAQRWAELKQTRTRLEAGLTDGAQPSPPTVPTLGNKVGLTMLIDFEDAVGTVPQAEIFDFLNSNTYTNFNNRGSVKKYYQDVSNGALTYSNVVTIYIRVPHPKTYYNDTSKGAGNQGNLLIKDALDAMKALPDYTNNILPLFDNVTVDSRQRVVAFNVFFAGGDSGVWDQGLWPHSWSLVLVGPQELSPGGKQVYAYQITNIGNTLELGTFCHENGHMLCDFPDLYDYTYDSVGAGMFCLMGSGSSGGGGANPVQICAYLKRAAGWGTTVNLNSQSNLLATLNALPGSGFNTFYRYAKPGVSTEYYIFEARYRTNRDASVPGSGVVVWHIDELGSNSTVNTNANSSHNNYEATVVQADNRWDLERNWNSGDAKDLYYLGNSASGYSNVLSDVSKPHSHWWDGTKSSFMLRNFSAPAPTMTVLVGTNDPSPQLLTQPADRVVLVGSNVTLTVTVAGLPPFSYQWLKNGSQIPGATQSTYLLPNVRQTDSGPYAVVVTNAYGSATSTNGNLVVINPVPLAFALNNSNLVWTTDSGPSWYGQQGISHDGEAAAQSWYIGDAQQSSLSTTVTGPGTLTFWWRVSSQANADYLSLAYAGATQARISGEIGWEQRTCYLPEGIQTVRWTYAKNGSGRSGQDAGWVDQVSYVAGATAPIFLTQPSDVSAKIGAGVAFTAAATGTPPLQYQWQLNGVAIPGATNTSLSLPSVRASDSGVYSVLVSNPAGSIPSANAMLVVMPLAATGDNSFTQSQVPLSSTGLVAISAGAWHSLALRSDGKVIAWGNPYNGQCDVPPTLGPATRIAAGGYHSLALTANGTVAGWGANDYGQATPPAGLTNVTALAAGAWHSLALRADGRVTAWGDNSFGQTTLPPGLTNVIAIAAAGDHSLALRSDGTVLAWGQNEDAAGFFVGQSIVPPGLSQVVAIGAGDFHSLAVKIDGSVVAWGDNSQGQCRPPAGLPPVIAVAGGGSHTVALKADGTVTAWGNDANGQCDFPAGLTGIVAIAAGEAHTLVLAGIPTSPLRITAASRVGQQFLVQVQTVVGKNYALQYQDAIGGTGWTALPAVLGDGTAMSLVDPNANSRQRFYRVCQY